MSSPTDFPCTADSDDNILWQDSKQSVPAVKFYRMKASHDDMKASRKVKEQPCLSELQSYLLTYLLTPWSRVLLEKLTVNFAATQEIPRIYGTRKFLTVPTSACHLSLSWANSIQSPRTLPTSWRSILILSSHLRLGLPNGLFPSGFPTNTPTNSSTVKSQYRNRIRTQCVTEVGSHQRERGRRQRANVKTTASQPGAPYSEYTPKWQTQISQLILCLCNRGVSANTFCTNILQLVL
jgi:hypothetical protein